MLWLHVLPQVLQIAHEECRGSAREEIEFRGNWRIEQGKTCRKSRIVAIGWEQKDKGCMPIMWKLIFLEVLWKLRTIPLWKVQLQDSQQGQKSKARLGWKSRTIHHKEYSCDLHQGHIEPSKGTKQRRKEALRSLGWICQRVTENQDG